MKHWLCLLAATLVFSPIGAAHVDTEMSEKLSEALISPAQVETLKQGVKAPEPLRVDGSWNKFIADYCGPKELYQESVFVAMRGAFDASWKVLPVDEADEHQMESEDLYQPREAKTAAQVVYENVISGNETAVFVYRTCRNFYFDFNK